MLIKNSWQYLQSCHHGNIKSRIKKSKNYWLASKVSGHPKKDLSWMHKRKTMFQNDFECDICEKTFSKASNLKAHYTVVHKINARSERKKCTKSQYGNVEEERTSDSVCCLDCFDTFPSIRKLKAHCKQVHNKTAVSTYCLICGQYVILNQDCHGDVCYDILKCLHCQKLFFKFKDIVVHSLETHPHLPIQFIGIENEIESRPLGLPKCIAAGSRLVRFKGNKGRGNAKRKYPFEVTYMESKKKLVMFGKTVARICAFKVCSPGDILENHVQSKDGTPCEPCAKKVEQNKRIEEFLAKKESNLESKKSKTLFITGESLYPLL